MHIQSLPIAPALIPAFERDLWEWDRCVWSLIQQLAATDPTLAAHSFGIDIDAAMAVAEMSQSQLDRLASGVLISFYPRLEVDSAVQAISEPYDLTAYTAECGLDSDYWLLLAQAGRVNPDMTALKFGLPRDIVELFSQCSIGQIRQVAGRFSTNFALRFPPDLLIEYSNCEAPNRLMMRKLALSLTHSKKKTKS